MPTDRGPRGGVSGASGFVGWSWRSALRAALVVAVAVVVVVAGVALLFRQGVGPLPAPEGCVAKVNGTDVQLSTEQAENAATISAIAVARGMPARAASIALATAMQESKLSNLDHGDRDSVGLFQQRPSQGWGTTRQIQNPYYATNRFYDELQKVDGYESMRITEAAQRVQRSGFPEAYDGHAADARALASALTGYSPAAFSCVVHDAGGGSAAQVRRDVARAFGSAAGQVSTAHDERTLDVVVGKAPVADQRGWAVASYLVAHAARLQIATVSFDRRVWRAGSRSEHGWRASSQGSRTRVHVRL
jgi:hypothetical protein